MNPAPWGEGSLAEKPFRGKVRAKGLIPSTAVRRVIEGHVRSGKALNIREKSSFLKNPRI
jgi:hypothetical protein